MFEMAVSILKEIDSITAENPSEKSSALVKTLTEQPCLREPRLREGVVIKWHLLANREAVLVQGRGLLTEAPCNHCRDGHGPFVDCVVLPGQLGGSCASCHYNKCGARCSFRGECTQILQSKISSRILNTKPAVPEPPQPPSPVRSTPKSACVRKKRAAPTSSDAHDTRRAAKLHRMLIAAATAAKATAQAQQEAAQTFKTAARTSAAAATANLFFAACVALFADEIAEKADFAQF